MPQSQKPSASKLLITLLTLVAFLAAQLPRFAFAQNSAQAEVLFKEGKQLLADKQYGPACQRLAASQKLDPSANTQLLLGLCYGALGKTASAYNAYLDASSSLPKGSDAQKYAADEAHKLETKLLKVRVVMALIPKDVAITFDDEKARDKDFIGIDIALDPGDHTVTITAPGKHDYAQHFKLDAGNSPLALQVSMTDKTQAEIDAENKAKEGGGGGGGGQVVPEKPETHWSTVRTVGLVTGVVGLAVLAAAGVSGVLALIFNSDKATEVNNLKGAACDFTQANDPGTGITDPCHLAWSYYHQALTAQGVGIGLAVGGGVVFVAGLIMFLVGGNVTTEPKPADKASWRLVPMVGPNLAGVGVGGTF